MRKPLGASYALCTALDAAAADTAHVGSGACDVEADSGTTHSLAVHFHGDSNGGVQVFRLVSWLVNNPQGPLDLLELVLVVLRLGFEGVYRHAIKGRRELENMQYRIHSMVSTCRTSGSPEMLAHWRAVERFINESYRAAVPRAG